MDSETFVHLDNVMIRYITFLLVILSACRNSDKRMGKEDIQAPPPQVAMDTTDGKQYVTVITDDDQPEDLTLSKPEILHIDKVLKYAVGVYNQDRKDYVTQLKLKDSLDSTYLSDLLIDLRYYRRQYLISMDKQGHKLVRVNAFCNSWDTDYWKTHEIVTQDGGKCYFNMLLDLTINKIVYFKTNGSA